MWQRIEGYTAELREREGSKFGWLALRFPNFRVFDGLAWKTSKLKF